jgi:hypothetical protein
MGVPFSRRKAVHATGEKVSHGRVMDWSLVIPVPHEEEDECS